jgi:chromosome segregation ATPase
MVFPAMLCGIAFLGGCLLMLTFIPSIHKRAVRLTTHHIMATEPIGMAEIRAERDRSRAQFAVAIRSLEVSVEELKTKCATQAAEVGRRAAKIHSLEAELKERPRQSAELGRQAGEIQRLEAELKKRVSQSVELARQAPDIHRLEAALQKCASQSAEIGRQAAEIHRLEAELKKRAALISVLRVRGQAQHAVS